MNFLFGVDINLTINTHCLKGGQKWIRGTYSRK